MDHKYANIYSVIDMYKTGGIEHLVEHLVKKHCDILDNFSHNIQQLLKKKRYDEVIEILESKKNRVDVK